MISSELTENYSFFGENQNHIGSRIIRTADDENFEDVYNLSGNYLRGDFYSSSKDNEGNIYFGSFAQIGYKPILVGSPNEGDNWFKLVDYPVKVGGTGGIFSISNFNNNNYAYYDNASISFKFYGLDLTDNIFHVNLNENTGTTVYDTSGNANNGTIEGATWNNDGNLVETFIQFTTLDLIGNLLLKSMECIDCINDLTGVFRKLASPSYFIHDTDLIMESTFINLTRYNDDVFDTILYNNMNSNANRLSNYSIFSDYTYIKKVMAVSNQTNIYNLSNALIFNTNGSIYGSSTISENDGNINITLSPNNASYVLDDYKLIEGVTREHSPLTISRYSDNQWHITSTIEETIKGIYIEFPAYCSKIERIGYQSDSGAFVDDNVGYTCVNDRVKIPASELLEIENADGSNVLLLTLTQTGGDNGGTSPGGDDEDEEVVLNETTIDLQTIDLKNMDLIYYDNWCFYGDNQILMKVYNLDDELIDVNISMKILNEIVNSKEIFRKNKGEYKAVINIPKQNITEVEVKIIVEQNGKTLEETRIFKISECEGNYYKIQNIVKYLKDNWVYFSIGIIIFMSLIMLIVLVQNEKK
ncbi:MAG: hypothetical protein J7L15_03555 [Clostridiales bacterium]|nr:hypothetical protein [Clostridiales bacterium]